MMFDFKDYYDCVAAEMPNPCALCEVGVADGDSVIYLAKKLKELGKEFIIYAVDNMGYGSYFQMKQIYENIIAAGFGNEIIIIPQDSIEASKRFNGHSLHHVFIDSSHEYSETRESIIAWYPKLLDGYKLAGHDYFTSEGVNQAVNELIPETITREPFENQTFAPEQFLYTKDTDEHYGVWYCVKDFYKKIT